MVYCDFATQKVTKISFEDLQVNDKVIMCIGARKWRTSEAAVRGEYAQGRTIAAVYTKAAE